MVMRVRELTGEERQSYCEVMRSLSGKIAGEGLNSGEEPAAGISSRGWSAIGIGRCKFLVLKEKPEWPKHRERECRGRR